MISGSTNIINPPFIRLEASTACQLKCPSCPTASGETGKKLGLGFLKFRDFKNIVDKNPFLSNIELSNWGEIFLNNELISIIEYAYRKNIALYADNGANLNDVTPDVLEALAKYRFRRITCSIDGASQESYSVYRVKGDFNRVIENIRAINRFKAKYKSPYPYLRWQYIVFGHNEHEIKKARHMSVDLDMEFYLKLSWEDLYGMPFSPVHNPELIRKESALGVANRDEFRKKFGYEYAMRDCCLEMWSKPQINIDGRVLGCPVNYWGDYGNAFEAGLKETLNNEKIRYAREMLMGRREGKAGIPCVQCKVYRGMKKTHTWMTEEETKKKFAKSRAIIMLENKVLGRVSTMELARKGAALINRIRPLRGLRDLHRVASAGFRRNPTAGLASRVDRLEIPLEPDETEGWKPYPIFRGRTPSLKDLSCHVSVLNQDRCPHLPHAHREEELLLMLSGEADLIFPDQDNPGHNLRHPIKTGEFVYYPAHFMHTLQTTGDSPAHYLMFKWNAARKIIRAELKFGHFPMAGTITEDDDTSKGFRPRRVFQGRTTFLKKLECHISTMMPGAGYDPHVDHYDVAIVVLEGEVETLGMRARPHDVIFYRKGKPHGMCNPGSIPARYIVFEFHA